MTMTHDELIDALMRTSARHELIMLVSQAVKERDAFNALLQEANAQWDRTMNLLEETIAQRDAAREALANIGQHIDPYQNGLQMFIAAEIDTALVGKVEGAE